ncbi:MAG: KilA-N domain-containing protein, partial [Methylobacter sp.]
MTNQIITLEYDNTPVFFHEDAFINATEIAKKFSKLPKDYLKTSRTKEYIKAIRRIFLMEENQLVKVQNGGTPSEIGTWLHPRLAIDFARWLSADFAVWCDMQIEKILHPDQYGLKQLPEPPTITKAQQGILFNKVVTIAAGRGQIRTQIWSRFQNHFKLSSYKNLP